MMSDVSPVLLVGSMAFDDLELPSGKFSDVVGGSATYSALSVSLFAPASIVAVVGGDFPEESLLRLQERGIDTGGVERVDGKTFRWAGRYSENLASRETLDTQLNVFADFRPKLNAAHRRAPFILLGNIHPALQLEVLDQVERPQFIAADTMNFWIERERPTLLEVLKRIDTLVINDEELRQLSEIHNVKRAARAVLDMGPKRLIVKRGEYGCMLFDGDEIFFAPAYPLEDEIDPTGAGDTFAGALIGYLARTGDLEHRTLRRAVVVAATVASHCVEGVGTERLTHLRRSQLQLRIDSLRMLVHSDEV